MPVCPTRTADFVLDPGRDEAVWGIRESEKAVLGIAWTGSPGMSHRTSLAVWFDLTG